MIAKLNAEHAEIINNFFLRSLRMLCARGV
jgi:hypothetical protein